MAGERERRPILGFLGDPSAFALRFALAEAVAPPRARKRGRTPPPPRPPVERPK